METVKSILGAIPTPVWVILFVVILICGYWFWDDIGSMWEHRKQVQFDKKIAEQQAQIDALSEREKELVKKAEIAEAREQTKIIEADLLRQEAAKKGVNIDEAQKKIDAALVGYQNDAEYLEKVKTGEVSQYQLCTKQCQDSAALGYPCRANYCNKFQE